MGDDGPSATTADDQPLTVRAARSSCDDHSARRAFAPSADEALGRPIRDLLPSSHLALALVTAASLLPLGAMVLAHVGRARVARFLGVASVGLFDLEAPRNASRWFAATLMVLASLLAIFIYSLRRHRVDDYHGRYRVWIWTAIACLVASLSEATNLAELARGLSNRAAALCGLGEAFVWPIALAGMLALAGLRLLLEIWRSRGTVALWLFAVGLFLLAAATSQGWMIHVPQENRLLVMRSGWLAGYLVMLATFLWYTRHVALEIEGKITVVLAQPKKPAAKKKKHPGSDEPPVPAGPTRGRISNVRTDLESLPEPAGDTPRMPVSESAASGAAASHLAGGNGQIQRPLSKKERRRLRREARMQARSS